MPSQAGKKGRIQPSVGWGKDTFQGRGAEVGLYLVCLSNNE